MTKVSQECKKKKERKERGEGILWLLTPQSFSSSKHLSQHSSHLHDWGKKALVCTGFCCAAPSDTESRNWLILLSLDHCPAMGKRSLPPRKDSYHTWWCNLLPSPSFPQALTMYIFPSKFQSKCTAQEGSSLFPSDGDGKEVGALSCQHSSQYCLPGILPSSGARRCSPFPLLTAGHGTAPPSVALGIAALTSPGSLLEKQNLTLPPTTRHYWVRTCILIGHPDNLCTYYIFLKCSFGKYDIWQPPKADYPKIHSKFSLVLALLAENLDLSDRFHALEKAV